MKKYYFIAAAAVGMIISGTAIVNSNSTGGPAGRTGSPGDNGVTCAQGCHSGGTVTSQSTTIQVEKNGSAVSEWDLGEIYDVVVTVDDGGASAQRYGFSLTAEDENGNSIGTLISPDNETQINGIGGTHITHTFSSNTPSAPGSQTWNFQWQAPNSGVNDISFYAVGVCANGNGTNGGDVVVTSNPVTLNRAPMSLEENNVLVRVYPNPASRWLQIESAPNGVEDFEVFDMKGQRVGMGQLKEGQGKFDVTELPMGSYILRLGKTSTVVMVK